MVTQAEVHSDSSCSYWPMQNSSIQCIHSSTTDRSIFISSNGNAHDAHGFPLAECKFEEPDQSEAHSTHTSEIELKIIRINEEYEKSSRVYNSQRIDQQDFFHVGGRRIQNHEHFMQPYNVQNNLAKHLLTESMLSVNPSKANIPTLQEQQQFLPKTSISVISA